MVRLLVVERSSRSASRQNLLANHRPTQNHRRSSRHTDHWHHLTLRDTDLPTLGQDIRPYRALVVRMQLTDGILIPAGWRRFSRRSTRRRGRASFLAASKPSGFAALQSGTAERVAAQRACEVDLQTLTNGSLALRAWRCECRNTQFATFREPSSGQPRESSSDAGFRRPCTSPLSRISFLLFLVLFVLLYNFGLGSEGLSQSLHLISHKRVSRSRCYLVCGDRLLSDCFGHLHESSIASPARGSKQNRLSVPERTVEWPSRLTGVASNASLTLNGTNGETRRTAPTSRKVLPTSQHGTGTSE